MHATSGKHGCDDLVENRRLFSDHLYMFEHLTVN